MQFFDTKWLPGRLALAWNWCCAFKEKILSLYSFIWINIKRHQKCVRLCFQVEVQWQATRVKRFLIPYFRRINFFVVLKASSLWFSLIWSWYGLRCEYWIPWSAQHDQIFADHLVFGPKYYCRQLQHWPYPAKPWQSTLTLADTIAHIFAVMFLETMYCPAMIY